MTSLLYSICSCLKMTTHRELLKYILYIVVNFNLIMSKLHDDGDDNDDVDNNT